MPPRHLRRTAPSASVSDIAGAKRVDRRYADCILRLTVSAPDIVEAIVQGR
jgi:hypothetical protein